MVMACWGVLFMAGNAWAATAPVATPVSAPVAVKIADTAPAETVTVGSPTVTSASQPKPAMGRQIERLRQLYLAVRYYEASDFKHCEEIAARVMAAYPGDTVSMTLVGACRIRQNNFAGAVQVFQEYTTAYPLEAIGHFYLGLSYHLMGDKERALESYWTATLLDPRLEAARANMRQLDGN